MKAKEFDIKKRDPNWRAMQDIRRSGAGGQHKDKKKAAKQGDVKHKARMAEGVDIGKEWMSDTELDQYVPDRLQDEWRELVGYDIEGKAHPLWANMTGGYEPDVNDPEDRANMVKVANKWFSMKKIPNVKFYDVKDADDELEWLVQIGEQGVSEGADELYGIRIGDTVTTEFNGREVQGDVIDLFPDDMQVELLLRGPESGRTVVVDVRDTEFFEDTDNDEPDEQYLDKVISDLHKDALGFRPDQEFGREWMSSSFEEKLEIYNNLLKNLHSDIDEVMAYGTGFGSSSRSSFPRRRTSSMLSIMQRMKDKEKKKTPEVGDRIEFGRFNKPDSMKKATVVKVGDGGLTLTIKTDDGEQGNISLGNKSLSYKILEDDKETISLPFGTVTRPKPTIPAPITQRPGGEKEKENMPPKIKRLWDRIKQEPKLWAEVLNAIDDFDTLRDDEIEDEINAFLSSDTLIIRAVGIVLQYEYEKMKNESVREASDFGEPREILEDVLRTLEREVEWPLTDVMDPREVKQLLAPIVKAVNDKMMSMSEAHDDWGSMSHKEFKRRELEHELGHENKPRENTGMWFYNVPKDKELEAKSYGLKQTKSGKWYSRKPNSLSDKAFGQGRYWEPK